MPRNTLGVYTLPSGNPVAPGTLIQASWANSTMFDVAETLTNSLDRLGRGGMLVPFKNIDGTLANPGITFQNEISSGIARLAPSELTFITSAVRRATLSSTGLALSRPTQAGGTLGLTLSTVDTNKSWSIYNPTTDTSLRIATPTVPDQGSILENGRFGWGILAPEADFHVAASNGANSGTFSLSGTTGPSYFKLGNKGGGGAAGPNLIVASDRTLQIGVGNDHTDPDGGTFTSHFQVAALGVVGVGAAGVISPWDTYKTLQVGAAGSLASNGLDVRLTSNAYFQTPNWKRSTAAIPTHIVMDGTGAVAIRNAVTGAVDSNIAWVERLMLTAAGRLGLGVVTPATGVEVLGAGTESVFTSRNSNAASFGGFRVWNDLNIIGRSFEVMYTGSAYAGTTMTNGPSGEQAFIKTIGAYPIAFGVNGTAALVINADRSVNLSLGAGALRINGHPTRSESAAIAVTVGTGFLPYVTAATVTRRPDDFAIRARCKNANNGMNPGDLCDIVPGEPDFGTSFGQYATLTGIGYYSTGNIVAATAVGNLSIGGSPDWELVGFASWN